MTSIPPAKPPDRIDKVRASRDGHQFHEAWVARHALGLLLARGRREDLWGIAVEGLSPEDGEGVVDEAVEIADVTLYYGDGASFGACARLEVAQLKYSISRAETPFRMADAKKTLGKFVATDIDLTKKHGRDAVVGKVRFVLVTNRPFAAATLDAVEAAAAGIEPDDQEVEDQLAALKAATGLDGEALATFAGRLSFSGRVPNLQRLERGNGRTLVDWSQADDVTAGKRLGDLRALVRDKAGSAGQKDNLITVVEVLHALGVDDEQDLLPARAAFVEIGPEVERPELADLAARLGDTGTWLVTAAGGLGKTVFLQSLADRLRARDEVVLFDCFGGGAWRAPQDGRHRLERGLLHIVNELAGRGLCDPVLPSRADPDGMLRTALKRLHHAVAAIRSTHSERRLVLLVDAADNAGMQARDRGERAFPEQLVAALAHEPIDGLVVVASARPERAALAVGDSTCPLYPLAAFSSDETKAFVAARRPEARPEQIAVLHRRAGGNPRVLANLIEPGRALEEETATEAKADLDTLISERIDRAIQEASWQAGDENAVPAFLCGLSVLPPPAPVDEIAAAFGIAPDAVESFAADLAPLLERTREGLVFRDEPTETLVRSRFGDRHDLLGEVVDRLHRQQDRSVYAARSLPGLLFATGRKEALYDLAFDERFPAALGSDVARRTIRRDRLRMALRAAATTADADRLVPLLVELAAVTAVDEKGEDYLLDHPDLVSTLGDADMTRRLSEARGSWPGQTHARLAIAYLADGDLAEARPHARRASEWIQWYLGLDARERHDYSIEADEIAATVAYLFAVGRPWRAMRYARQWRDEVVFEVALRVCRVGEAAHAAGRFPSFPRLLAAVSRLRSLPPAMAAALVDTVAAMNRGAMQGALASLGRKLPGRSRLRDSFALHGRVETYSLALQRCAMAAVRFGLADTARAILAYVSPERFLLYSLDRYQPRNDLRTTVLHAATLCAAEGRRPMLFDVLPRQLWDLVVGTDAPATDEAQVELLQTMLSEDPPRERDAASGPADLSKEERRRAAEKIGSHLLPILALTRAVAETIAASDATQREAACAALFSSWRAALDTAARQPYPRPEHARFVDETYWMCLPHALRAIDLFEPHMETQLLDAVARGGAVPVSTRIQLVHGFARRPETAEIAGRLVSWAKRSIEAEDDVPQRARLFADLARALLPASLDEARALLLRGAGDLDAIGSGDQDLTSELLTYAAALPPGEIRSEAAYRLAQICELNLYEDRKFPWTLAGAAISRVWGLGYLAQIGRWEDRDKANLEYTLPVALTALCADGRLPAEDMLGLMRLVSPGDRRDWTWVQIIEAILEGKAADRSACLAEAIDQLGRRFPNATYDTTHEEIRATLDRAGTCAAEAKSRLAPLLSAYASARRAPRRNNVVDETLGARGDDAEEDAEARRELDAAVASADPADAASIDAVARAAAAIRDKRDAEREAFATLRARVPYRQRNAHLEAIVAAEALDLYAKTDLLAAAKDAWAASSESLPTALAACADALARRHAAELLSENWGPAYRLKRLAETSGRSIHDLAHRLVEAAGAQGLEAKAGTWLYLASRLVPRADAGIARSALQRLLDSGATRLAEAGGDGPWSAALDPGADADRAVAGLIWFRLGAPEAEARWRAAHAMRALARLGRWPVIDALFTLYDAPDAGAFQARHLPFFRMSAQHFFLVAVARIAIDHPAEIRKHRASLEAIASDAAFPHVVLRETARRALLAAFADETSADADALRARLAAVNVSPFAVIETSGPSASAYETRPNDVPEPDPRFWFDYDFRKTELVALANHFGLREWELEDRCIAWIRQFDPSIEHMDDFAGRDRPHGYTREATGAGEAFQSYGAYLARHALALTAGELLGQRALVQYRYSFESWDEWLADHLASHRDGLWLSDGTDVKPAVAHHHLRAADEGPDRPCDDVAVLAPLIGLRPDGTLGEAVLVDGFWSSPDDVEVLILSALVPPSEADIAARALATAPPFHAWLPTAEHDVEFDAEAGHPPRRDFEPLEPWIVRRHAWPKLDAHDPHGARAALGRSRPAARVIETFGLASTDPWQREWRDPGGRILARAEAWGRPIEGGSMWNDGFALRVPTAELQQMLEALGRDLLVMVRLQLHLESAGRRRSGSAGDDDIPFRHSLAVFRIGAGMAATRIVPSAEDLAVVGRLSRRDQADYRPRLAVLRRRARSTARGRGRR